MAAYGSDWDNLYFGAVPLSDWGRRESILLDGPTGTFQYELGRIREKSPDAAIAPASETFVYSENSHCVQGCELHLPQADNDAVEKATLDRQQYALVTTMRSFSDAHAAFASGSGLPEDVRLYTAGAVAFAHDQMPDAMQYFRKVLALPNDERRHRGLWAQYMLGRSLAKSSDAEAAAAAFQRTRALATGAEDPLGLAVASLGDEGRLRLAAKDYVRAIHLYAQQAEHDSRSARDSLKWVAHAIYEALDDARVLGDITADPLTVRVMIAYIFSNFCCDDKKHVAAFLAAMSMRDLHRIDDADRLAAIAYRLNDFNLAEKFADNSTSPLSSWIKAKIALTARDKRAAMDAYIVAGKGFARDEDWGGNDGYIVAEARRDISHFRPAEHVARERAILSLSEGNYPEALTFLYHSPGNYADASYLAERVLTLDELKAFVDAGAPAEKLPLHKEWREYEHFRDADTLPIYLLRNLLARRLMRADRRNEATMYFEDPGLSKKALAYAATLDRAANTANPIERAQAWYQTAKMSRFDGMELLATEFYPDDRPYGNSIEEFAVAAARAKTVAYLTKDEIERVAASHLSDDRLHYRYVAIEQAERAANLLPPRSQAFAAVLCRAAGWVLPRDSSAAQRLYSRYVQQGALMPSLRDFGQNCPEPDFARAADSATVMRIAAAKHFLKNNVIAILIATCAMALAIAMSYRRLRVRRTRAA